MFRRTGWYGEGRETGRRGYDDSLRRESRVRLLATKSTLYLTLLSTRVLVYRPKYVYNSLYLLRSRCLLHVSCVFGIKILFKDSAGVRTSLGGPHTKSLSDSVFVL